MEKEQLSFFEETNKQKRRISIPIDKLYISLVFFIITMIISFSFGVEKGKRINLVKPDMQDFDNKQVYVPSPSQEAAESNPAQQVLKPSPLQETLTTEEKVPQKETLFKQTIDKQTEEKKLEEENLEEKLEEKQIFYSIQVASYSRKDVALAEINKLKKKGHEPILLEKGKFWALCVGRFRTKEEAKTIVKNLKICYNDCFIRKL